MGDDMDFGYIPSYSGYDCPNANSVRDCDGDTFVRCDSYDSCPYKKSVRDCDGDWLDICTK